MAAHLQIRGSPRQPKAAEAPKELCVVLSVGAEQGLAHIGVLTALREKGVPVSCVVGNSMGAMVGGLYAARPEEDLAVQYQSLAADYEGRTRKDLGPVGVGLLFGVNQKDWRRLKKALGHHMKGQRIESLNIGFVTEHQVAENSSVRMEPLHLPRIPPHGSVCFEAPLGPARISV